jgi:hypothetical protein
MTEYTEEQLRKWRDEVLIDRTRALLERLRIHEGQKCDCSEREEYLQRDWSECLGIQPRFNCGPLSLCVDENRREAEKLLTESEKTSPRSIFSIVATSSH